MIIMYLCKIFFLIVLKGNVDDKAKLILIELSTIFQVVYGSTLHEIEIDLIEAKIVRLLCCLDMIFLPSFFTIMVHLTVHLTHEARTGPVIYHWMYSSER